MVLALLLLAQLICAILACVPTQIITTTARKYFFKILFFAELGKF